MAKGRKRATPTPQSGQCPTGHKLPHRTKNGRCTPFDCADQKPLPLYGQVPEPTKEMLGLVTADPKEYARKRIEQALPAAAELTIKRLKEGSSNAADSLLDRGGLTRKPEGEINDRGPLVVLNLDRRSLPWEQTSGRVLEVGDGKAGAGAARSIGPGSDPSAEGSTNLQRSKVRDVQQADQGRKSKVLGVSAKGKAGGKEMRGVRRSSGR